MKRGALLVEIYICQGVGGPDLGDFILYGSGGYGFTNGMCDTYTESEEVGSID